MHINIELTALKIIEQIKDQGSTGTKNNNV